MENKEWSISDMVEDYESLTFEEYLEKYYNNKDSKNWGFDWNSFWSSWMANYVDTAFDDSKRAEFVKNFGLVDESKFDYEKMASMYSEVKQLHLFPTDIERFIGFMAGTGFFMEITLSEWLHTINWQRNQVIPAKHPKKTLVEIINVKNGDNFLRANLPLLNWWRR